MTDIEFVKHEHPANGAHSDFIINARIDPSVSGRKWEQLWVRRRSEDEFELCCVPFFIYGFALGDIVRTRSTDKFEFELESMVQASGFIVFRVAIESASPADASHRIISHLVASGVIVESFSATFFAVASPPELADSVRSFLVWAHEVLSVNFEDAL